MNKFDERKNSFEKKFQMDQELQFKVQARSIKYLAEFVQEVANDETFAKRLTFAIETELQDRHYLLQNSILTESRGKYLK